MELHQLPTVLFHETLCYLSPTDLLQRLSHVNRLYHSLVLDFLLRNSDYQVLIFNGVYFPADISSGLYLQCLLCTELASVQILTMRASYTSGGVFNHEGRYWVQNMFDYTGTVYTTNGVDRNVRVRAAFEGVKVGYRFEDYANEDVHCLRSIPGVIAERCRENSIPTDTFLRDGKEEYARDFTPARLHSWPRNPFPVPINTYPISSPSPDEYLISLPHFPSLAFVTHIGVARPAFFTCPVRTLMVFSSVQSESLDLQPYYDLIDPMNTETQFPPIINRIETSDYLSYEFECAQGPLVWVQYRSIRCSQVAIALRKPRVMRYCEVLLVDMEDRRRMYGYTEMGMDVMYVVFAGKILPSNCPLAIQT